MGNQTPTRRAMLGAIGIAPVTALVVASPTIATATADKCAWDRAVKVEHNAWDAYQHHLATVMEEAERAYAAEAITFAEHQAVEKENDRLYDLHGDAYQALLLTPAPDAQALSHKLRRAIANQHFGLESGDCFDAIPTLAADAARLAGEG